MPRIPLQNSLEQHQRMTIKDYLFCHQYSPDIQTTTTACHYGGYRHWFVCGCGRRVGVLYYRHSWACRHCMGLPYQSQLSQPKDRINERINAIRERLGWVRGVANGHGNKPKGMHQRTYQRLISQHDRLTAKLVNLL